MATYLFVGVAVVAGVLYFMRRRSRMSLEDTE